MNHNMDINVHRKPVHFQRHAICDNRPCNIVAAPLAQAHGDNTFEPIHKAAAKEKCLFFDKRDKWIPNGSFLFQE
jgi:hypothetical protein